MRKILIVCLLSFSASLCSLRSHAQAEELAQLALNIEKLLQYRQILSDLKKGYDILFGGYTMIKNISEGNFNLHKTFLDGLLQVSPAVKKYKRVADIVDYQLKIVKEYKAAMQLFQSDGNFSKAELDYISGVYSNLAAESLKNLDALAMVITAGKTRMSDDERIRIVDNLFTDTEDKLSFLRSFNNSTKILSVQRQKERNDAKVMRELYAPGP